MPVAFFRASTIFALASVLDVSGLQRKTIALPLSKRMSNYCFPTPGLSATSSPSTAQAWTADAFASVSWWQFIEGAHEEYLADRCRPTVQERRGRALLSPRRPHARQMKHAQYREHQRHKHRQRRAGRGDVCHEQLLGKKGDTTAGATRRSCNSPMNSSCAAGVKPRQQRRGVDAAEGQLGKTNDEHGQLALMTRMRSSPTPLTISTARPCPPLPALVHFSLVVPSHSAIVYTRKQRFHHRPPRPTSTRTQRTRAERGPLPRGAKSASSTSTSRRHAENCGQPGYSLTPDTLRPKATLLFPSRILLLPTNARLSATRTPAPHRSNARRHPSLRTHAHAHAPVRCPLPEMTRSRPYPAPVPHSPTASYNPRSACTAPSLPRFWNYLSRPALDDAACAVHATARGASSTQHDDPLYQPPTSHPAPPVPERTNVDGGAGPRRDERVEIRSRVVCTPFTSSILPRAYAAYSHSLLRETPVGAPARAARRASPASRAEYAPPRTWHRARSTFPEMTAVHGRCTRKVLARSKVTSFSRDDDAARVLIPHLLVFTRAPPPYVRTCGYVRATRVSHTGVCIRAACAHIHQAMRATVADDAISRVERDVDSRNQDGAVGASGSCGRQTRYRSASAVWMAGNRDRRG
ncbi:hypothetical protein K438DRAFT_1988028 [Mycena galopus ATCC 62051]|nr:hypothetical protein K438DRAFT_1988028 [Mycena galopus ATCC 62051]